MNAQLQLFFTNIDKINLYFGSDAKSFYIDLALKLTVRNVIFHYEDYEAIRQEIKNHTKWYHTARVNQQVINTYYVHFAKQPEKIGEALNLYKSLTKQFSRGEHSYITSAYLTSEDDMDRIQKLLADLMKQPSLKYSPIKPATCAILARRPEDTGILANTIEHYYKELVSIGYERKDATKNAALILTIGTGTFDEFTFSRLKELTLFIKNTETKLKSCHYATIALLALAKFEVHQFPALYDIHNEICRTLKLNRNQCNTLLITTQIYTSNEAIGDIPSNESYYSDIIFSAVESSSSDGVSDGGGGGGD
ncbi:DUF4003 family protein [Solibacillus sp. A46]|uniref:DUF4003 family protein n=1 Tax=Solibacillus faecavium TaxID=2762221 RepID=A0ABR8XY02_9BACL|nr:DUF4003 family protein [Solibacillus faecavium]MBD8036832.1 DUF4003 family protein [Solibacillus faecavium]